MKIIAVNGSPRRCTMKFSSLCFTLNALACIIIGILYIYWPMAPYHARFIALSPQELSLKEPLIYKLVTTLVDLAGISFLTIGIMELYLGIKAWRDKVSFLLLAMFAVTFLLPLVYLVYSVHGPLIAVLIVLLLHIVGLISAGAYERAWKT
jgi:hypothetical protein